MVQLIAKLRRLDLADALTVRARLRINIDSQQRVVEFAAGRVKRRHEYMFFGRDLHRQSR
jgi:hypothetical protein